MKKFIPLLLAVFAIAFVSCEKDPDMDKLDSKYLVYTNYDTKADFKAFETYYLPDSILVIGNSKDAEYWKDESAQEILSAYVANMNNQGEKEKLPVLWTSYMSGLLSGSTSFNTKMAVEGVNQAFTQSAYLNRMSAQPR